MDEKPTSGEETSKNIEVEKTTERQQLEDDNRPFRQLKKETGESGLFW